MFSTWWCAREEKWSNFRMFKSRYDFEQNKRNNLIFYGIPGEERETRDDLRSCGISMWSFQLSLIKDKTQLSLYIWWKIKLLCSRIKIANLLRLHLNIRRELPISKASRMYTGKSLVKYFWKEDVIDLLIWFKKLLLQDPRFRAVGQFLWLLSLSRLAVKTVCNINLNVRIYNKRIQQVVPHPCQHPVSV